MLKVCNLDLRYQQIQAVKGVSFEVSKAEIVTLLGANGAGKSSILRAISGLIRPFGGEIFFEGINITRLPCHEIVKLGIVHVPEGRGIFANLKVIENLEMGSFLRRDKKAVRQDIERVFTLFPILRQRQNQYGATLSGGEQQMLAIARALVAGGKLILLDEPSLGLAPRVVESIFQIIARINREGLSILLVEQNAHQALEIAHRGYILETGSIVLADTASNLAKNQSIRKAYLGE
ncbi:MAG: ABC transporter ATP-binding protein [bacterium]|nr:ABC transporter ATP-binding protein [bacterium]